MYKYFGLVFIIRLQIPSWLIHIDGLGIVRGFLRFIFTNLTDKTNLSSKFIIIAFYSLKLGSDKLPFKTKVVTY